MSQSPPRSDAPTPAEGEPATSRPLTPEATRALAEAEARRQQSLKSADDAREREIGGREGPDPVRFGDWEKGGIASDF